jgi:hypothetical protein
MVACSIGRQFLQGAAGRSPRRGTAICGFWPKPTLREHLHISRAGICMAILAVPTLLDFWITCSHRQHAVRVGVM